jgi:hypothetical protein
VFDRLGVGIADLAGVFWLRRRLARPLLVEDTAPPAESAQSARPPEPAVRQASVEPVR